MKTGSAKFRLVRSSFRLVKTCLINIFMCRYLI